MLAHPGRTDADGIHIFRTGVFEIVVVYGGTVKVVVRRIVHVAVERPSAVHEPVVFRSVGGGAQDEPLAFGCRLEFAQNVALGTHFRAVPAGEFAPVHLEAVVVFGDRRHIARARLTEQTHPCFRIEVWRGKHGDEIFVAEVLHIAEAAAEIFMFGRTFPVHMSRVPFGECCGHAEHPPMDKDAEFTAAEPLRRRVSAQGIPIRFVFSRRVDGSDFFAKIVDCHGCFLLFLSEEVYHGRCADGRLCRDIFYKLCRKNVI